ncbi:hypothetical protein KR51_00016830 [Rubidibacter lacunae KORDI 51-2]|uniref:Uncharacterized protein n=1 Tax=Rubidibacter lacunae KORDI 51-2 TaxID=582515 RepID=U5DLE3_9CHRO|nr:hypothetical protein KR51_00016830 [Rubidibacter lacunae KORDI 51-2]
MVVAVPAGKEVDTVPAIQAVAAVVTIQHVVAVPADKQVVAVAAIQAVVAIPAIQAVVAVPAIQAVVALTAFEDVVAVLAVKVILAEGTFDVDRLDVNHCFAPGKKRLNEGILQTMNSIESEAGVDLDSSHLSKFGRFTLDSTHTISVASSQDSDEDRGR